MDRNKIEPANSRIPGWKIEPNFRPGVLMGNWDEESRNFAKGNYHHNTIYRTEYRPPYGMQGPDVIARRPPNGPKADTDGGKRDAGARGRGDQRQYGPALDAGQKVLPQDYSTVSQEEMIRRKGEMAQEGMPTEQFFYHHGNRYLSNMVTWYDENYNGRWREKNLPALRKYDQHSKTWRPEKSDVLVQEPPTNFGLLAQLQNHWAAQLADQERGSDYLTTYGVSYKPYSPLPRHTRYATPMLESTILHPVNRTLKDLHLRSTPILKCPEQMPAEMTYVSV